MFEILFFKVSSRVVKGAELDGDAGSDPNQGGESALVECEWAFVAEDPSAAV